ncbi:hypothetical protein [Komagataeibacter diospyri]|nr:hypothetical protein [Komagataeibacter diospyri]
MTDRARHVGAAVVPCPIRRCAGKKGEQGFPQPAHCTMPGVNRLKDTQSPQFCPAHPAGTPDKIGSPMRRWHGRLRRSLTRFTRARGDGLSSRNERSRTMTTLHDHIQMLRAELTSFHLSRRERRQIERELKQACAQLAAEHHDKTTPA